MPTTRREIYQHSGSFRTFFAAVTLNDPPGGGNNDIIVEESPLAASQQFRTWLIVFGINPGTGAVFPYGNADDFFAAFGTLISTTVPGNLELPGNDGQNGVFQNLTRRDFTLTPN